VGGDGDDDEEEEEEGEKEDMMTLLMVVVVVVMMMMAMMTAGSAQLQFMSIENIHRMRESLARMSQAFYTHDGDFWGLLASSRWIAHVRTGKWPGGP
jgi:flagellar basal body-associated protein FliL